MVVCGILKNFRDRDDHIGKALMVYGEGVTCAAVSCDIKIISMKRLVKHYKESSGDLAVLALRIAIGITFVAHGLAKYTGGVDNVAGFFGKIGIPAPGAAAWIVTLIELLGGAALIIGLGTRIAAGLIAAVMAVAMFTVHWGKGFFVSGQGGIELVFILLFSAIAIALFGPGKYSLDAYLSKKD